VLLAGRHADLKDIFLAHRLRHKPQPAGDAKGLQPEGVHRRDPQARHRLGIGLPAPARPPGDGDGGAALVEPPGEAIVLCRPPWEAGEKLGFLPGDLAEIGQPLPAALYDALHDLMEHRFARRTDRGGTGRSGAARLHARAHAQRRFRDPHEAQNTTTEQMKMFLTRRASASKAVIIRDRTQVDLPSARRPA